MKYVFQLMIIFAISFVGELLNTLLPLPVPASVYGLILLFILLLTKVIKLNHVEDAADFLMSIMPLFFLESTVRVMNSYGLVRGKITVLFLAAFLSFAAVTVVTGLIAQGIIRFRGRKGR
ncbi:MAG: CidA/LrgA family protein [Lachnospiraceae bacterium]